MERNYIIFNTSEINLVNWSNLIGDKDSSRFSVDGSKVIIEYIGSVMPASVQNLSTKQGPYNQQQAIGIMNNLEWSVEDEGAV